MSCFKLPASINIHHHKIGDAGPYGYAVNELTRILRRMGFLVKAEPKLTKGKNFAIAISSQDNKIPKTINPGKQLNGDSYRLNVGKDMILLSASSPKGVLNSVYDLAERLGVVFLLPTENWEWVPSSEKGLSLKTGVWEMRSRFKHRGVFLQLLGDDLDFTEEEWLCFYAKLRFNAVRTENKHVPFCKHLGLRVEVGGHGLPSFLPRELFDKEPELFRMFQPEDFNGKRMKDANLCVSNLKTKKIVQENFAKHLETVRGAYAVHAWADDLPAGGWCLCPSCRALPPTDQAMLAMRYLAEAAGRSKEKPRIPVIAYHDTMRPGREIDAPKEGFFLYAPRERCYGHSLDDPSCERNRFYMNALREWVEKFKSIDDGHTFEYYFDQILFRGIYPFLPSIILDDMKVYEKNAVECHMSLQVGGPAIAPEFNMLAFARGLWDSSLTEKNLLETMANDILPNDPQPWNKYLSERSRIFTDAMRMCGHNLDIYLDYRWLPENTQPFGKEIALAYKKAAADLDKASSSLEKSICDKWPERVCELARKEVARGRFEAAELRVMNKQQEAMNELGAFMNSSKKACLKKGIDCLESACLLFKEARDLAERAKLPARSWYFKCINEWLTKEFEKKIKNYGF